MARQRRKDTDMMVAILGGLIIVGLVSNLAHECSAPATRTFDVTILLGPRENPA